MPKMTAKKVEGVDQEKVYIHRDENGETVRWGCGCLCMVRGGFAKWRICDDHRENAVGTWLERCPGFEVGTPVETMEVEL